MKKSLFLLMWLSVFIGQTAMADFYTWEDEKGETQITDYPPPTDRIARDIQIRQYLTEEGSTTQEEESTAARKANVLIYTKNNCPE